LENRPRCDPVFGASQSPCAGPGADSQGWNSGSCGRLQGGSGKNHSHCQTARY